MFAAQQQVQQQAERIHVGGGGNGFTQELLGRRILRRESDGAGTRQLCRLRIVVNEFCDAKIQQLHRAVGLYEYIRRFDVAVNDQIAVGMRDGAQNVLEQAYSRPDIQSHALAVGVDGFAFHVLEHQVGLRAFGDPRVQQPRDVRMVEPGEGAAFEPKALFARLADPHGVNELDRHGAFVAAVGAMSAPHAAHAAPARLRVDDIRPDVVADQGRRLDTLIRDRRWALEKACKTLALPVGQGALNRGGHFRILISQRAEPRRTLLLGHIHRLVQQPAQQLPALIPKGGHESPLAGPINSSRPSRKLDNIAM